MSPASDQAEHIEGGSTGRLLPGGHSRAILRPARIGWIRVAQPPLTVDPEPVSGAAQGSFAPITV
ncbi:MAG: hypothetical protein H0T72_09490 [Chloroflexia bacterium]|nr:hypothetical protein [Chloroflexia bacterium]